MGTVVITEVLQKFISKIFAAWITVHFIYKFDEIGDLRTNSGENKRKWAPHITEDSEPNSYILIDINAKSPNYGNKYARTFERTPL